MIKHKGQAVLKMKIILLIIKIRTIIIIKIIIKIILVVEN